VAAELTAATPSEDEEGRAWVGRALARKEDPRLLTGRARFVADLDRPGLLHAAFVRAPVAAASITGIDLSPALATPEVVAAFDAAGLGLRGLCAKLERPEFVPTEMPVLAAGRTRYVGEPVALVVAGDAYTAEDATEAVRVSYQELAAVTSVEKALSPGAPAVHPQVGKNLLLDVTLFRQGKEVEDIEAAIGSADVVVEATFSSARLSALPLEGRVCLAEWVDRDGQLVVHASTQVPHQLRTALSESIGLRENQVRVIVPEVGGGFGLKCVVGREEVAIAGAALRLGRPVRWVEDRYENLVASFHGHEQEHRVRAGFSHSGHLLALSADIYCDVGAYSAFPFTCGVEPLMAASEMPGPYRLARYAAHARAVATNKAPTAPYRGVSRPQITLVMERLMDKAARRLDLDPVEIRRRNLIQGDDFPYLGVTGITYDPGSYRESLDLCHQVLEEEGWFDARAEARTTPGRARPLIGIGVSCFNERTAYGTAAFAERRMAITPGYDRAEVRMEPDGSVLVTTGTCAHGQGHETTIAQVVADQLGLDPAQVRVRQGDTDLVPYGWGTFGSRSAVIGGGAAHRAASELAGKLCRLGAHLLEASPADIELTGGVVRVRGTPSAAIPVPELAQLAHLRSHQLPPGLGPGLSAQGAYDPPGTFSNATHGVVVEVDPGTGGVRILRYIVVEDCGVVINPLIVDGQVRGGVAQGIAAALLERHCYDDSGQPLTASLVDYLAPAATEVPDIDVLHLETPSPSSPTGAKGMGEGGTIGAPAAILNAVNDALGETGADIDSIPILPEHVLAALEAPARGDEPAALWGPQL
jgi:carbon-monoxide dehydrogenase large subunit